VREIKEHYFKPNRRRLALRDEKRREMSWGATTEVRGRIISSSATRELYDVRGEWGSWKVALNRQLGEMRVQTDWGKQFTWGGSGSI